MESALAEVPARELYERTGIQLMPINTVFELAAMAAEADAALDAAETLLLIPDLLHYWLCGVRTSRAHQRNDDAMLRSPRRRPGRSTCSSGSASPPGCCRRWCKPGTKLGRLSDGVAEVTGLGDAVVIAVATHDTGSAVAAVPFRRPGSAFISAGTWSLVGVEVERPLITDATSRRI